jgi:hypothetical protein
MKKILWALGLALTALACNDTKTKQEVAPVENWVNLFNGTDLSGWVKKGGEAPYRVEDGTIVGTTIPNSPNTFLSTADTFQNFILELELRLEDSLLNSGVQIRSHAVQEEGYPNGKVYGYQVEVDPKTRAWSGGIYEEKGRGWIFRLEGDDMAEARAAFKLGEWNHYRIYANQDTIRTWVNGVPVANLIDSLPPQAGFIGLQVHSTREEKPMEVSFRNIRLLRL